MWKWVANSRSYARCTFRVIEIGNYKWRLLQKKKCLQSKPALYNVIFCTIFYWTKRQFSRCKIWSNQKKKRWQVDECLCGLPIEIIIKIRSLFPSLHLPHIVARWRHVAGGCGQSSLLLLLLLLLIAVRFDVAAFFIINR